MADDLVRRLRDLLHGHPDRSEILPPDLYNPIRDAADRIEALETALLDIEFHVKGGGDIQALEIIERVLPYEPYEAPEAK